MGTQMGRQTPIRRRTELARRQIVQLAAERQPGIGQTIAIEAMSTPQPPQGVGPVDEREHFARQTGRRATGRGEQAAAAPGQMGQALLVRRRREAVVNAPAVVNQCAGPIAPNKRSAGWPLRVGSIT